MTFTGEEEQKDPIMEVVTLGKGQRQETTTRHVQGTVNRPNLLAGAKAKDTRPGNNFKLNQRALRTI